jgi:hypothetical protein
MMISIRRLAKSAGRKVLGDGEVDHKLGMLEAYLQVLLEANEEQFKEVTAMINSPIIERPRGYSHSVGDYDH